MGSMEDTEIDVLHLNYDFAHNIVHIGTEGIGFLDKCDSIELIEYLIEQFNIQETEIGFQGD